VRLRQLGRLGEARECFGAVVREIDAYAAEPEEMEDASYAAAQSCELLVIAGRLTGQADSALASGQRAVEYADRGADPYFSMHARSSLAEVYLTLGQPRRAAALFKEARTIDRGRRPRPPFLYSQSLYRYGYHLIEDGRAGELIEDEASDPNWGTNGEDNSLLSAAIRLLVLGAARRSLVENGDRTPELLTQTQKDLDDAINMFRTAGYADYTVRGLLERAHFYQVRCQAGDYAKAQEDLDRATYEAERGDMKLLSADIILQRVACHRAFCGAMSNAQRTAWSTRISDMLTQATKIADEMGYFRHQSLLHELESVVT
jgi:tetratricopeptide (TPR) repeat protein